MSLWMRRRLREVGGWVGGLVLGWWGEGGNDDDDDCGGGGDV